MKIENLRAENTGGNVIVFYGTVNGKGFAIDRFGDGGWYPFDYDDSLNWEGDDYVGKMDDMLIRYTTPEEASELLAEIIRYYNESVKEMVEYIREGM